MLSKSAVYWSEQDWLVKLVHHQIIIVKVHVIENQKYLNSQDKNVAQFFLRKYEVPADYIENDWDVTDEVLIGSVHIIGIEGIKQLEFHLNMYVDNLSSLVGEWKCDNPL